MGIPAVATSSSSRFEVDPEDLHRVAGVVAGEQDTFHQAAKCLVSQLDGHAHAVGVGSGPEAFNAAYEDVAARFLGVWSKSVASIGGVAVGLAETANNYAKADHASNPQGGGGPSGVQAPPHVVERPPSLGNVAKLGSDTSSDDGGWYDTLEDGILGGVSDLLMLKPVFRTVLRHGKVADVSPGGDEFKQAAIAGCWGDAQRDAQQSGQGLDAAMGGITDSGNSDWQAAMTTFCRAIWGTSAWGKSREGYDWGHGGRGSGPNSASGASQPVLEVLEDTSREVGKAFERAAQLVTELRSTIMDVYQQAATDLVRVDSVGDALSTYFKDLTDVAWAWIDNLDTERLNRAVDHYNDEYEDLAQKLRQLLGPLDEAHKSAPTYRTEEARAEAYGARSLHEFKKEHNWTVPGDQAGGHAYPIDLANQEGVNNAHAIDKHVGKTDEQLLQRLRDQTRRDGTPAPTASSTFSNMASAQRFTQGTIDQNNRKIDRWLAGDPPDPSIRLDGNFPGQETGRSVGKTDYIRAGDQARVESVDGVKTIVKRAPDLDPPFVVVTSYPGKP